MLKACERPELWGGVECTINRVQDEFHSQLQMSGHATRSEDLDLIAGLGIRTLRLPILWESVAAAGLANADWRWTDACVHRLHALAIKPIAGLVHHGSGPRQTNLIDPAFPELLATYARSVAQRYPGIDAYTPINEPLTTARFSGLYGLWYPHARDAGSCARALITQCRGTVLAMRAIRRINPAATLVQTDDLGKVHSTPALANQADFENERRWLGWDLLCGRVDRSHALWGYLCSNGISEDELLWFGDNPCPPDVIGINHYVTSNRFLHQNAQWCAESRWGNNGRERYADTETARILRDPADGIAALLGEAWERYRLPLAITEAHLGCTREEQLRWLHEMWHGAVECADRGIDVRAVTVWSLFGNFDWNTLLTEFTGHYEPGVFDVRGPKPRPTALARMAASLASSTDVSFPSLLRTPGWWRRPAGLLPELQCAPISHGRLVDRGNLLITGASGTLGQAFARVCDTRGIDYCLSGRSDFDIGSTASIARTLDRLAPWAVVNTAGYVRVDEAESDGDHCYRINTAAPEQLARACALRNLPFVSFSSDLVFDGAANAPYIETDTVRPLNVYGASKAAAELRVLQAHPDSLMIRTSAFFGPWDQHNFLTHTLSALARGGSALALHDSIVSATYVPDLVNASLDLLIDGERGLWHLANPDAVSWMDLAIRAASLANIDVQRLSAVSRHARTFKARRPAYSALGSQRGVLLPDLDDALRRYVDHARSSLSPHPLPPSPGYAGAASMPANYTLPYINDPEARSSGQGGANQQTSESLTHRRY